MFFQVCIVILVLGVIFTSTLNPFYKISKGEWILLEVIWTVFPALILIFLGVPRLELLYKLEGNFLKPDLIVKVIGHQWYWEYNFTEFDLSFDSFTTKNGIFRLAEVSEKLVLPFNTKIQLLVTRRDVIHSFSLPNLRVKSDATPGRLNLVNLICKFPSLQIGICSELCGTLHSNMSIVVEFTSVSLFKEWLSFKIE
jgi:cytochrome c oxidase subunit 2